jgi:hypothetical protein
MRQEKEKERGGRYKSVKEEAEGEQDTKKLLPFYVGSTSTLFKKQTTKLTSS